MAATVPIIIVWGYETYGGKATAGEYKNESMPSQPVLTVGKFKTVSTYNQFLKSKMTAATTETTKKQKKKGLSRSWYFCYVSDTLYEFLQDGERTSGTSYYRTSTYAYDMYCNLRNWGKN